MEESQKIENYIEQLKPNGRSVNFNYVKDFVKTIPVPKLMFSLNHDLRKKSKNFQKSTS